MIRKLFIAGVLLLLPIAAQAAATPSPNLNDQQMLAADGVFQARVKQAVIATCIAIGSEATTVAYHYRRVAFSVATLGALLTDATHQAIFFASAVATDSTTINAATVNGTVPLSSASVAATQAALVPDTAINSALSGQWNSFFLVSQQ